MVLRSPNPIPASKRNETARRPADKSKPSVNSAPISKLKKSVGSQKQQQPLLKKKKRPKDASTSKAIDHDTHSEVGHFHEPIRRTIRPENQLDLDEKELKEDITRILTGDDPSIPKNVCKFSYKDKCYKPDPPGQGDNMAIHYSLQGSSMHVDSQECKKYKEREEKLREQDASSTDKDAKSSSDHSSNSNDYKTTTTSSGTYTASSATSTKVDHTKNQFDYSERASQTFNNPLKSQGVHTEPPPVTQYQEGVTQWQIYDSYKSECLIAMMEHKEEGVGEKRNNNFEDRLAAIVLEKEESEGLRPDAIHSEHMENSLKIMERLVNQNAEDEIFQDFKYWEDASDQYRHGEGTLLPLWRFATERTNRKQVTSMCWNPRYNDMFAVGYGSYEFMRQGSGMVCCFSLKNTSYPEYVVSTESGVMCLDFHPQHPSLLAVGCYDGTALVYDIGNGSNKPIYSSSLQSGKHSDPVWQVRWHDNGCAKEFNFYSISSDGKVANWTMSKNELKMEQVMSLKLANTPKEDSDEPTLCGLAGGCSFDFNKKLDNLFLVGTEEGSIHECSKAYSGQYIKSYEGHHMGVHSVKWNPFHENIFISCSADWTVKIWDHNSTQSILQFDLGNAVGDVCWSPYSSTVFAAVTTDGKVHVFDLAQNKREPLCAQKVVKRARLTKASFNLNDFILIVGDDRGGVNSLKLSPNLRKSNSLEDDKEKNSEGDEEKEEDNDTVQRNKMLKLLASIDKKYAK